MIRSEGGVIREVKKEAMPRGTSLEVRSLFFNVPARKKFLKSVETELGHITDLVNKIGFSHPEISIELFHQGKPLVRAAASEKLENRAYQILGGQVSNRLVRIEREFRELLTGGVLIVKGLISPPDLTFSTTRHLYLYINRRYVRDKLLTHSILEAYRTLIPKMRYPAVVLFLEMPPDQVDVNVHPTKLEVRFPEAGKIHQAVMDAIRPALLGRPLLQTAPAPEPDGHKARVEQAMQQFFSGPRPGFKLAPNPVQPKISDLYQKSDPAPKPEAIAPGAAKPEKPFPARTAPAPEKGAPTQPRLGSFSELRVIGQFHSNYLVLESEDCLVIIDQHAAHERINFEKLREELSESRLCRQNLLFPEVVELDYQQAQVINKDLELIESLGFEIQPFGPTSFLIKTTPGLLENLQLAPLIKDLADELNEFGKSTSLPEKIDHLLSVVACHSSVRAGRPLSEPEIQALLKEMDEGAFPGQCPHGRPAIWKIPLREIEKKFSR
jgi:DNA mismatch repair protein MutL